MCQQTFASKASAIFFTIEGFSVKKFRIGLLLLFFLSKVLVKKAFIPVDISIRKQKEFVAAASHELKSPLVVIQANAFAIKFDSSRTDFYIKGITNESQRMSRLIQDMLFLASNDTHNRAIQKEPIDTETFLMEHTTKGSM